MSFQIFDTHDRKKVSFEPHQKNKVLMYNCGPTVYDFAHIGNFRAYIFADLLRRWLEVSGYDVRQVMNLTDVDDKTIRKSQAEGVSLSDVTSRYIKAFFEDIDRLHIQRATLYPPATEHIDEMVDLVKKLMEKRYAYKAPDGSIYFSVAKYANYGSLSGKRLEDLRIGERVTSDEYESKDDVRDFALWKAYEENDGDVYWETELGKGRPGWHIECSAMSMKHLGSDFDIHTGGVDNIFPHHENELAQSHCATGAGFSKYWMHCDYLIVEGKKMSKSLGNFYTIRDLVEKGYTPREIRYILIGTHYRSRLNFTLDGLSAVRTSLKRIDEFHDSWQHFVEKADDADAHEAIKRADKAFDEAMNDDMNVSAALAAVFNLIREVNALSGVEKISKETLPVLEKLWTKWNHALGLFLPFEDELQKRDAIDEEWIKGKIEERLAARKVKDWAKADAIRGELTEQGILIKDGPDGTTWKLA